MAGRKTVIDKVSLLLVDNIVCWEPWKTIEKGLDTAEDISIDKINRVGVDLGRAFRQIGEAFRMENIETRVFGKNISDAYYMFYIVMVGYTDFFWKIKESS